jgi:hypothetical protein
VISYNPGYQSLMKDLKQSTKQRFVGFDFDYPAAELEASIVATETGINLADAVRLVKVAAARALKGHGLDEGISTRLLVYAATPDQRRRWTHSMRAAWHWCARSPTTPTSAPRSTTRLMPCLAEPVTAVTARRATLAAADDAQSARLAQTAGLRFAQIDDFLPPAWPRPAPRSAPRVWTTF